MTFEENPFRVLQISIYDDKATIVERADDLSFAEPDREKIFDAARDILLNPRKRLAAEVAFFAEAEIFNVENILGELEVVDEKFSALDAAALFDKINEAREKSKFPAAQDFAAVETELENIRAEIRKKIQAAVENLPHESRLRFANELADKILSQKKFGVVIEDFFESYRLNFVVRKSEDIRLILETLTRKILSSFFGTFQIEWRTRKDFKALKTELKLFREVVTPLNKISGVDNSDKFSDTFKVFEMIRTVAFELLHEKNRYAEPRRILKLFEKTFRDIPAVNKEVRASLDALREKQSDVIGEIIGETFYMLVSAFAGVFVITVTVGKIDKDAEIFVERAWLFFILYKLVGWRMILCIALFFLYKESGWIWSGVLSILGAFFTIYRRLGRERFIVFVIIALIYCLAVLFIKR